MNHNQLQAICEALASFTTKAKITDMLSYLNLRCNLDETAPKWKRLFNAIANDWNKTKSTNALVKIIEWIMTPSLYADNQET